MTVPSLPSFGLPALPPGVARPLVVAIAFLPILIMALCAIPAWAVALWSPATHSDLALRLLKELRGWSREVISAVYGGQSR